MTIVLRADDENNTTLILDNEGSVTIGRRRDCDLVIADAAVSRQHARIVHRNERTIVVDLKSTSGTMVNGKRIPAPMIVREEQDVIRIGQVVITLAKHRPGENDITIAPKIETSDPKEREMITQLQNDPKSDELRQVYGDWLMEHGRPGEMIAIERHLRELPNDARLRTKLHEAASKMDIERRALLTIAPIENCKDIDNCPRYWDELRTTPDKPAVRNCTTCTAPVFFVQAMNIARWHSRRANRIVIDPSVRRQENDLFQGPPVILDTHAPDTKV